jgi:hypothetical protein
MKNRFTSSLFTSPVLAALLLCTHATAATTSTDAAKSDAAFNEAMDQYRDSKWPGAYGRFAALADQGNPEAARIALLMLRYGSRLYGHNWGASQPQINRWMKLAVQRMEELTAESGD